MSRSSEDVQFFPRPTAADGAALFEAREVGRAAMCTVDEAEQRAVGFTPQPRGFEEIEPFPQAVAPMDDPVIVAAGARLVARGLATPEPTPRSVVTASGPLLVWFTGVLLSGGGTVNLREMEHPPSVRTALRRRVTVVSPNVGFPMTLVEYLDVPQQAGPEQLPVRIDAVRPDVLVEEIADAAFAPLPDGATRSVTDMRLVGHPGFLAYDGSHAVLATQGHGLRGRSERQRVVDRERYAAHLATMLHDLERASAEHLARRTR